MNPTLLLSIFAASLTVARLAAQTITFDFDSAPVHTSLPLSLSSDGVTAQFSSTGQGFSVQPANTLGFTPVGFAGNCIYPNSINGSDLLISFSQSLTALSILYAPEEYACDSSATLRVTAFMDSTQVGTATMTADPPGTWPSATLSISPPAEFNNVLVHYDAPPPTGGDWGPIFMADNLVISTVPEPPAISVLAVGTLVWLVVRLRLWRSASAKRP